VQVAARFDVHGHYVRACLDVGRGFAQRLLDHQVDVLGSRVPSAPITGGPTVSCGQKQPSITSMCT
jgi:hypothetical protein